MIKRARIKRGLTQKQLADILGTSQSYISKIENRLILSVSIEFILRLSKVLKLCPIDVFSYLAYACPNCHLKCRSKYIYK